MRVLLDCSLLNVGGSIQVGLAILKNASLTPRHKWHVVLSENIKNQVPANILKTFASVNVMTMSSKLDRLKLFKRMSLIERQYKPDVVFTVLGPAYWRAMAPHLQGFAHPTMIYSPLAYCNLKDRGYSSLIMDKIKARLFCRADALIVETETVRKRLKKYIGFPTERIFVAGNSYSPLFKKAISDSSAKIKGAIFSFLIPSSYYKHKNLESVIPTAEHLKTKTCEKFEFVFTLQENGAEWIRLKKMSEKSRVASFIRTVGVVPHDEIGNLYRHSNAVFLPTLLECSSAVYPESFMAKLPVATSDLDFAHELCKDGALYFDPTDPKDMAEKLLSLMTKPDLRNALIFKGSKVLFENFPSPYKKWKEQLSCIEKVSKLKV